jgi:hypothetical protein
MKDRTLLCTALIIASAAFVSAQTNTTAAIGGTVSDPSDSAIPGAKVVATNTESGLRRETISSSRGEYRFILLPPGNYEINVEAQGFSPLSRKSVKLTVGEDRDLDLSLAVGASSQVVEVQSAAPLIETERSQQANTIGQQEVANLPISRRDYLTFALLAPGVSDSKALADATSFRVKQTPDSGLSFYGSNGRGNSIAVDGGEANDSGGGVRPTVSQETVQEFQVNRATYSAEYGGARGGIVNIITKSGGNQIHGSGFGFFRQQGMDATEPFAYNLDSSDKLVRVKPDSNRQQFGFTIGGPIAKDKTFFFMGYEGLRRRESKAVPVLTDPSIFQPTAAQEAVLKTFPAAVAAQLRPAFVSPQSTIDMFRKNSGVFPFASDDHKGLLRLDHRRGEHDMFTFRYNATNDYETNEGIGALVGFSRGFVQNFFDSNALVSWTHIFSASVVNEFRGQFNYYDSFTGSVDPYGPALEIAGYGFFNRDRFLPSDVIQRRYEMGDNLSIMKGRHNFRIGGTILPRVNHTDSKTFMSGRFTFGTLPAAFVSSALPATLTINALQAFNLGLAQSYQQGFGDGVVKAIYPFYAFYAQDNWHVTSNLTVNYGLRYEADMRKAPLPSQKKNFSPRIGLAWDPFNDKKTTIRAGYGIFYAPIDFQIDYVVNALAQINGYRQIAQVLTTLNAANPLAVNGPVNIFQKLRGQGIIGVPTPQRPILATDLAQFGINVTQTGALPPLTVLFGASPDYRSPNTQQASFGIEREIGASLSLAVNYVFVRGAHLTTSHDINLLTPPINPAKGIHDWGVTADNPTGAKYFVNPLIFQNNLYESTANSFYHGLMLELNKRFSRNTTLHFNYTFSKSIDEATDYNSDFQPNDQTNRRLERALSSFDQRHKVIFYAMLRSASTKNAVLKGWTFTPIYRYNSARPFNLLAGTELNNDRHNTTDRPIYAGRNTGIGPTFWGVDARLSRSFKLNERFSLEGMAEAFNLFNHLNYASVNNVVGAIGGPFNLSGRDDRGPSAPLGFTSAFDPRRMQLGVRLSF